MSDQFVGEIRMFGGDYAPLGWALCDGSTISISGNEALYSLLGTTYGGDGVTTFKLPDLRGRVPIHQAAGNLPILGSVNYPLGAMGGVETVTLTSNQMPAHTHVPSANTNNGTVSNPTNAFWASNSDTSVYSNATPNALMNPAEVGPAGGNMPHNNMMPFVTLNFIIALEGNYPMQN